MHRAPDGVPEVSTYTIWKVLKEAGFDWQKTRSWCETGKVKRKSGEVVEVTDPDAKKIPPVQNSVTVALKLPRVQSSKAHPIRR